MTTPSLSPAAVERSIRTVRGQRVLMDDDLAKLYGVPTKVFNQAVKRHVKRFPEDFRFQLTDAEALALRSQSVTSKSRGGRRYAPYVFTQEGVAMLSSILSTPRAVAVNIEIMRFFVRFRQAVAMSSELGKRLAEMEATLSKQHVINEKNAKHFTIVFDALQRLMDAAEEPSPPARPSIGFKLP